jgi:hypothetical protein
MGSKLDREINIIDSIPIEIYRLILYQCQLPCYGKMLLTNKHHCQMIMQLEIYVEWKKCIYHFSNLSMSIMQNKSYIYLLCTSNKLGLENLFLYLFKEYSNYSLKDINIFTSGIIIKTINLWKTNNMFSKTFQIFCYGNHLKTAISVFNNLQLKNLLQLNDYRKAFNLASINNSVEIARWLETIQPDCIYNMKGREYLNLRNENIRLFDDQIFFEYGFFETDKEQWRNNLPKNFIGDSSTFIWCSEKGYLKIIKLMINPINKSNISKKQLSIAINIACEKGNIHTVKYLLDMVSHHKIDTLNSITINTFLTACKISQTNIIRMMILDKSICNSIVSGMNNDNLRELMSFIILFNELEIVHLIWNEIFKVYLKNNSNMFPDKDFIKCERQDVNFSKYERLTWLISQQEFVNCLNTQQLALFLIVLEDHASCKYLSELIYAKYH